MLKMRGSAPTRRTPRHLNCGSRTLVHHRLKELPQFLLRLIGGRLAVLDMMALDVDRLFEIIDIESSVGIGHDSQLNRTPCAALPRDSKIVFALHHLAATLERGVART